MERKGVFIITELEEWKDIPGFEGYYQISNKGRVKSLPRLVTKDLKVKKPIVHYSKEIIKTTYLARGYLAVKLLKEGKVKQKLIHRLIAEAFIPRVEGKDIINHKDGNKTNNDLDNLEWCTYSENNKHAYDNNLNFKGERHGQSKFTEKTIREIRRLYIPGDKKYGSTALARIYGMSKTNVLDIVKNRIWKDVV